MAFARGETGDEAEFGALVVANALVGIDIIAVQLGKKDAEPPPLGFDEEA